MDISVILTAHREGPMAGVTIRSATAAVEAAQADGLDVEILVVMDNPDEATVEAFEDVEDLGWSMETVNFKDQGMVRNHAVTRSNGQYIAFLDGDDLWSENWLVEAYRVVAAHPGRTIAHPEVNWFFQGSNNLFFHADQMEAAFEANFLRFGNYWDALCLAPRVAYTDFPYAQRALLDGYAYEDWQWNIDTMEAGFVHRVAIDTIHFKRRRAESQTLQASRRKTLTRTRPLHTYPVAAVHARATSIEGGGAGRRA